MSSPNPDDKIRIAQLKMQFRGTRKEDHETIESYVTKLQSIANSLAEIDSPVSDSDMVLQLLAGLPSEYLPLQETLSSTYPLPKFEQACKMVYMQQGILLQDQEEQNTSDPRVVGAEESSVFCNISAVAGKVLDVVVTVGPILGTVATFTTLAGAVGAVSASRIIGVGVMGVVAGWKIRQAFPRMEKNE